MCVCVLPAVHVSCYSATAARSGTAGAPPAESDLSVVYGGYAMPGGGSGAASVSARSNDENHE